MRPPIRAVTIISAVVVGGAGVVAVSTNNGSSTGAPGPPTLISIKRPVNMKWGRIKGATSYRMWRNGVVVKTVTALSACGSLNCRATMMIECNGNKTSRLNIQAQNSGGRSAMKPPVYRAC